MTDQPTIPLNDGNAVPQLGFGVWRLDADDAPHVVGAAIEAGYRHIDTAQGYENEAGVGKAIRQSAVGRDRLFITSKLRNSHQGYDKALHSLDESLERLKLDYLDLFLIHWPAPAHDLYAQTWKALVEAQKAGKVKSIGVSNFLPEHLSRIIDETGVVPAVNQLELHPAWQQRDIREFHRDNDIQIECYSPLGGKESKLLDNPVIGEIGHKHGKSPAQVMIRWHLQQNLIVLPKSSKPERAKDNFDVWDFTLAADDVAKLDALDRPDGKTLPQPNDNNQMF
ncbi:2,5-diketo-D-gluconate reductase A [Devosia lucknowensis]|uniref:2,5-diketo-D-gluconate reductase A n=1 Tax=Devosia lucknowensis TaxID=1096929 RepID=A0A1Y6ETW4_9HYPH|nr:aldo/keto reductase [Devosia lucknowensis]SMQ65659.1 2,5-diketo-D-gluconate reductase A [Devosia lucknowensis]